MGKTIDPSLEAQKEIDEFVKERFGDREFGVAEFSNAFINYITDGKYKWVDLKNTSGYFKRSEKYNFVGDKTSRVTGRKNKHYKVNHES